MVSAFYLVLILKWVHIVHCMEIEESVCQTNYTKHGNVCLRLEKSALPWEHAEEACKRDGGHLAVPDNTTAAVHHLLEIMDTELHSWVGMRVKDSPWHWFGDPENISVPLGCFRDIPGYGVQDLERLMMVDTECDPTSLTPQRCIRECLSANYTYAGTQNGNRCYCGNSYGKYGTLPQSSCDTPCCSSSHESHEYCGGPQRNYVYKTGSYSNWEYSISEHLTYPLKCGYMVMASKARWRGIDCNYKLFSLCYLRNHSDTFQLDNSRHFIVNGTIFYISRHIHSWFTARQECQFRGGDLARIKSEEESSKIVIELKKLNPSYVLSQIWISLTNFEMDLQGNKTSTSNTNNCIYLDAREADYQVTSCNDRISTICQTAPTLSKDVDCEGDGTTRQPEPQVDDNGSILLALYVSVAVEGVLLLIALVIIILLLMLRSKKQRRTSTDRSESDLVTSQESVHTARKAEHSPCPTTQNHNNATADHDIFRYPLQYDPTGLYTLPKTREKGKQPKDTFGDGEDSMRRRAKSLCTMKMRELPDIDPPGDVTEKGGQYKETDNILNIGDRFSGYDNLHFNGVPKNEELPLYEDIRDMDIGMVNRSTDAISDRDDDSDEVVMIYNDLYVSSNDLKLYGYADMPPTDSAEGAWASDK